MKKTITLILAIFLINCNKNDSVFEEVLSEVEVTTAKGINYEKLSGKWNFSSSSTSAKSMASCSINWIEFISNTDSTPNYSSGEFIMKLDVSSKSQACSNKRFIIWHFMFHRLPYSLSNAPRVTKIHHS